MNDSSSRLLDPIDRVSEILFGLIMAVSIVGSLSIATAGQNAVRTVVTAALGCNLAWGLVDAVMYLVRTFTERTRNLTLGKQLIGADAETARPRRGSQRRAKAFLLKPHQEGQLPYRPLVKPQRHSDSAVRRCELWLARHFRESHAVARVVAYSGLAERTAKRRFKAATGVTLIDYLQDLRVEEAKRLLETTGRAAEGISAEVGYQDASFFRRLFGR